MIVGEIGGGVCCCHSVISLAARAQTADGKRWHWEDLSLSDTLIVAFRPWISTAIVAWDTLKHSGTLLLHIQYFEALCSDVMATHGRQIFRQAF